MAVDVRSLVVKSGVTQQVPNDDTLLVGVGIKQAAGSSLTIGDAETDISIPGSLTIEGDLDVEGAIGVVSTTTFQQDATFEGNVTFGSDPSDGDTVSFANAVINSSIAFDGVTPTHKITNLADPTAGSQEAATAKYVDDGLADKLDLAGGTMSGAIAMGSNAITGLLDPSDGQDAATKAYADGHLGGVAYTLPAADGGADQVLTTDGDGVISWQDPVLTPPGGAVNDIQLNDGAGGFTGSANLSFVSGTGLTIGAITIPDVDGTDGQVLKTDGEGVLSWQDDSSAPAGNDTEIQFNDGGALGASANLIWDGSALGVTGDVTVSANLKADGELWIDEEAALPDGEAGYGKLAVKSDNAALYFVDSAGQAHYAMPDGLEAIASAASVTLDFDPELPAYRTITMGHNITFSTDGLAAGRGMSIRLDNSASGSARVLTFPVGWTWLGGSAPAQVEANKVAVISLVSYGSADSSVVAAWSYSDSVQITGSGNAGQIAYFDGARVIASEAGLKWDADNDRMNIGNADNSAHSANLRVGGSAHIGGEVWLDGSVNLGDAGADVITVNGAMSLASGASFSGVSGTVTLPAQFSIGTGNATSANVTAANLNTLTGGGDASSLHSHKVAVLDGLTTTGAAVGDAVYVSADDTVLPGDPTVMSKSNVLGIVTASGSVAISGRVAAGFTAGLSGGDVPAAGKVAFLDASGKLTTIAPTSGVVAEVGLILNASAYSGSGTCDISLSIKSPIQLV